MDALKLTLVNGHSSDLCMFNNMVRSKAALMQVRGERGSGETVENAGDHET